MAERPCLQAPQGLSLFSSLIFFVHGIPSKPLRRAGSLQVSGALRPLLPGSRTLGASPLACSQDAGTQVDGIPCPGFVLCRFVYEECLPAPFVPGRSSGSDRLSEAALGLCEEETGIWGCRIDYTIENGRIPARADKNVDYSEDFFPKTPVVRDRYAFAAMPDTRPVERWRKKSWVGSGSQGYDAGILEVRDRCEADSGVACSAIVGTANGVLVQYSDKYGQGFWTNALNERSASARGRRPDPARRDNPRLLSFRRVGGRRAGKALPQGNRIPCARACWCSVRGGWPATSEPRWAPCRAVRGGPAAHARQCSP